MALTELSDDYPVGMLTDGDIKSALGSLFSEGAEPARAKYSTYEIVLDSGYESIHYSEHGEVLRAGRAPTDGVISIGPGETVLVYSKEIFSLPLNVYARVNTVGQIFLAGFSAENTYIDPGFQGQISITLINNSSRVLSMREGAPLARVEFIKLSKKPEKTHPGRSGVRQSKVIPSIDKETTDSYRSLKLQDLINQVNESICIDAMQKRSIRSDVALTRAYMKLAEEIESALAQLKEYKENSAKQEKLVRASQRVAAFALATALALWLDRLGLTGSALTSIMQALGNDGKPTYWLNILVNIACSVAATPIFSILLGVYQNARSKAK